MDELTKKALEYHSMNGKPGKIEVLRHQALHDGRRLITRLLHRV